MKSGWTGSRWRVLPKEEKKRHSDEAKAINADTDLRETLLREVEAMRPNLQYELDMMEINGASEDALQEIREAMEAEDQAENEDEDQDGSEDSDEEDEEEDDEMADASSFDFISRMRAGEPAFELDGELDQSQNMREEEE